MEKEKITLVKDTIDKDDVDGLIEWLKTYPRLTMAEKTREYENKFSEYIGCEYSVFVNSGSSANLLMLYALKVMGNLRNQKVVVPALAWATDMAPVIQLGFEPLICDCNLQNLSVDVGQLESIFQYHKPAAMILVSVLGLSPDMEKIVGLCKKHGVLLLEDNCESFGTEFNDKCLGNFGLMSSFSTYFGHTMSCTKNTPIPYVDESGQFKIDSIENIFNKYSNNPGDIEIMSFNGMNKNIYLKNPSEIIKHKLGNKKILKLTLKNNREVEITEDHSVFKFNMGMVESVEGYNLNVGDKIIVPHELPRVLKENKTLDFISFCRNYENTFFVINYDPIDYENYKPKWGTKEYKQKENFKQRSVLPLNLVKNELDELYIAFKNTPRNKYIPSKYEITPELCRLIGYFIAEGCYKKNNGLIFSFNSKETLYINEVLLFIKKIFNINGYTQTQGNGTKVVFDSTTLQFFFEKFLEIKRGALNKRIPDLIWHTNKENQLEFLYGFFLGDGSQDETRIEFASASKELINDVSYLTSFLGLNGSFGIKVKPGVRMIEDREINSLNPIFGFRLYNVDFKNAILSKRFENRKTALVCNNEIQGNLQELEIKKIDILNSDEHEYVYDFSVPGYENFIGGYQPICLHNSTIEGGMITTNDKEVYNLLKMLRSHGWDRDLDEEKQKELRDKWGIDDFSALYTFYEPGFNVRSTDLQAVIGMGQLDKVGGMIDKRNENFHHFIHVIKTLDRKKRLWLPTEHPNSFTASFCYPIIFKTKKDKDKAVFALAKNNIETRPLICGSMGTQPFFVKRYGRHETINSKVVDECGIYVPNHPKLDEYDIEFICKTIIDAVE